MLVAVMVDEKGEPMGDKWDARQVVAMDAASVV
jgi:hypothetical protein